MERSGETVVGIRVSGESRNSSCDTPLSIRS